MEKLLLNKMLENIQQRITMTKQCKEEGWENALLLLLNEEFRILNEMQTSGGIKAMESSSSRNAQLCDVSALATSCIVSDITSAGKRTHDVVGAVGDITHDGAFLNMEFHNHNNKSSSFFNSGIALDTNSEDNDSSSDYEDEALSSLLVFRTIPELKKLEDLRYESLDAAMDDIKKAVEQYDEFSLSIRHKNKGPSVDKPTLVSLRCCRHGVYKKTNSRDEKDERETKRRKTIKASKSMKCGCNFKVVIKLKNDSYRIYIVYHNQKEDEAHNHKPMKISKSRRLEKNAHHIPFIKEQIKNGVKSSDIYQTLKNVYDSNLLQRDIYDIRCEQKRGNDQVTSSTSRIPLSNDWERLHNYLMKEVPHAIPYRVIFHPDTNNVKHLFFHFKKNEELIKNNHFVYYIDSTHSIVTNPSNSKLFNVSGLTGENQIFEVCSAFMQSDCTSKEDFVMILREFRDLLKHLLKVDDNNFPVLLIGLDRELAQLNAVREVFPNAKPFLCIYHVMTAVQNHLKKVFIHEKA